jgi:hypothetical protein
MAEAVLALPSPYLWLERSLHLKPREIEQTWTCLNLKTTKSSVTEGYCRWGRRSKARFLREKNPIRSDCPPTAPAISDWGKVPVGLDDRGSGEIIKDEMRGLDSDPEAYPYSLAAGERFRATSPYLSQLFAFQARFFEVDPCLIPRLSTDVDVPVETDGRIADVGGWLGAFCYDSGRMAGPVE